MNAPTSKDSAAPKPADPLDQPLTSSVEGARLVVSIGVRTLAWAAKKCNGGPVPNSYGVTNFIIWAKDVANALEREDEIGQSLLSEALDQAMQNAMDNGSCGLRYPRSCAQRPSQPKPQQRP